MTRDAATFLKASPVFAGLPAKVTSIPHSGGCHTGAGPAVDVRDVPARLRHPMILEASGDAGRPA